MGDTDATDFLEKLDGLFCQPALEKDEERNSSVEQEGFGLG